MAEEVKQEGDFKVKAPTKETVVEQPEPVEQQVEATSDDTIKVDLNMIPQKDEVTKLDLRETKEEEVTPEEETEVKDTPVIEEATEEEQPEEVTPILEEITEEEVAEQADVLTEEVAEAVVEAQETGKPLPENIQKVVDFIDETGGSLEDYVKLNQDFSSYDEKGLLFEYYRSSKPHLNTDEINFLIEDEFSINEDEDSERDIKRKNLALKEQVANAKSHLDGQKSKYYEEIKAGSKLLPEQKKAVDFFSRYNEELKETNQLQERQTSIFKQKTDNVFNDKFKGFEYSVGDKKYRFNVKDAGKVKETQGDINNFVKKFLNDKNEMSDAPGYHKSLFTAMNPDLVANHFYEQGKADAMKNSVAKAKNVDMDPRSTHQKAANTSGFSVRPVGDSSDDFKFKIRGNKIS
jgi:hypothetical protein